MKNTILSLLILIMIVMLSQTGVLFGVRSAFGYGGGGGGGMVYSSFRAPAGGVTVVINNGNKVASSQTVTLTLNGGSDAKKMAISNFSNFQGANQETYKTTKEWTLMDGDGEKTVYVKFYNSRGTSSKVASNSIIYGEGVVLSVQAKKVDTNKDNKIDILDFNALMVNWGKKIAGNIADFDNDEQVGILDFNLLMVHWT